MAGLENRVTKTMYTLYIHIYFYFIAEIMNVLVDRRVLGIRNVKIIVLLKKAVIKGVPERNGHY